MKRSEMQTVRVRPAPVVLVVSASPAFIRRCGDVAIQVQSVVVEASEQSFPTLATQTRAIVVVMPEATFSRNPEHFTALARDAGIPIITIPDESISQSDLEARLLGGISSAEKARSERLRR